MVQRLIAFNPEALILSLDAQKSKFRALAHWFELPQGLEISHFFTAEFAHLSDLVYGETLLQLGNYGKNCWLQKLHYRHKWPATPYPNPTSHLVSSFTQLPLDRESIDCIIAPLIMDAFTLQKNPLDEIDRILKPMGFVIFIGINRLSLWGIMARLKPFSCFGPLCGKPISVFSLQRTLLRRGYIQCHLSSFYYIPPVSTEKWLSRLQMLNELGKMISPCPAGFYCLVFQKQEEISPDLLHTKPKEIWKEEQFQPVCQ